MTDYSIPSLNDSESELSIESIHVKVKLQDLPQTLRGDYIDNIGQILSQDKTIKSKLQ